MDPPFPSRNPSLKCLRHDVNKKKNLLTFRIDWGIGGCDRKEQGIYVLHGWEKSGSTTDCDASEEYETNQAIHAQFFSKGDLRAVLRKREILHCAYCNPGDFRKRLIFVLFVNSWNIWKLRAH